MSFSVVFHRDSLFITILLLVITIILQGMLSFTIDTPGWVEKVNAFMEKNRVGQLFLTKHLVTTVRQNDLIQLNEFSIFLNELHVFKQIMQVIPVKLISFPFQIDHSIHI